MRSDFRKAAVLFGLALAVCLMFCGAQAQETAPPVTEAIRYNEATGSFVRMNDAAPPLGRVGRIDKRRVAMTITGDASALRLPMDVISYECVDATRNPFNGEIVHLLASRTARIRITEIAADGRSGTGELQFIYAGPGISPGNIFYPEKNGGPVVSMESLFIVREGGDAEAGIPVSVMTGATRGVPNIAVRARAALLFCMKAWDPEGDAFKLNWTCTEGAFGNAKKSASVAGQFSYWIAPALERESTVTIQVWGTDAGGNTGSAISIPVKVAAAERTPSYKYLGTLGGFFSAKQATDVAMDSLYRIYILDEGEKSILVYNCLGQRLKTLKAMQDPLTTLVNPMRIAVGRDDSLYILDREDSAVYRLDRELKWKARFIDEDDGIGKEAADIAGGTGERCYYVDARSKGKKEVRVYAQSSAPRSFIRLGGEGRRGHSHLLTEPTAMAVSPDGTVYVADGGGESALNIYGRDMTAVPAKRYPDGIAQVSSMEVSATGDFIFMMDASTQRIGRIQLKGEDPGKVLDPAGLNLAGASVCADPMGNMAVLCPGTGSVELLDPDGRQLATILGNRVQGGQALSICGCDDIAVLDTGANRVLGYDRRGIQKLNMPLRGVSGMTLDVAISPSGNYFVSDGKKVHIFDSSGRKQSAFGKDGAAGEDFGRAVSVCSDRAGIIYVLDAAAAQVFEFNEKGERQGNPIGFLQTDGAPARGGLAEPVSVAASPDGRVYVLDPKGEMVAVYQERVFEKNVSLKGPFRGPIKMDVDTLGRIYVLDAANVHCVSLKEESVISSVPLSGGAAAIQRPTDLAVGDLGAVYVLDGGTNLIHKFDW
ncbi:MAG TPA: NHL repeat-containing protein [Candidatus Brocadiia bacterium]|nr:NHL repeat-containing protein [Candidatus Brocadiia bacterium]